VAGARDYTPRDPVATIDWRASAKLATARGDDSLVVREHHAEEAPRVLLVVDRGPSMSLYDSFPWLSKPAAVSTVATVVAASAAEAHAAVGLLDLSAEPLWLPPRVGAGARVVERVAAAAPERAAEPPLPYLAALRPRVGEGSFVFLVSDFLDGPPLDADVARARGWELVPVVVQDATWERSFPPVAGVVVPFVAPGGTVVQRAWVSRRAARSRRHANEARHAELVAGFARAGLVHVDISSSDETDVSDAFAAWADRVEVLR
jgi:uncharacterized protein (DUF58 family)